MEATLSLNDRGVITLPAKLRQWLGLKAEDRLIAQATAEGILLRPTVTLALELYTPERIAEFDAAEQELGEVFAQRGLPPIGSPIPVPAALARALPAAAHKKPKKSKA